MEYIEKRNNAYQGNKNGNQNSKQEVKKYEYSKIFWDKNGNLTEELLVTKAREIADGLKSLKLSGSQLRAFYGEIKTILNRISEEEQLFSKVYPMVLMLGAKINYRAEKDGKKSMKQFKYFLDEAIEFIQSENKKGENQGKKAFCDFALFFEAVVGYMGKVE